MIKRYLLLLAVIAGPLSGIAQNSNAIFFTENGELFFVIINGLRQNQNPETNVKITGLNPTNYKVKIIFEDKTISPFDKNIFLESGKEYSYTIKNKNGTYVLRPYSMVDIQPEKTTYSSSNYNPPGNTSTTTTITQSSSVTSPQPQGAQFSMNVNLGGMNGNLGVQVSASDGFQQETVTTTTTTTTAAHYEMPGYSGPVGCPWPMSDPDFQSARQTISTKSFEDSKLTIAKQIINSNCLFSKQVRELMTLFNFEDSRIDLAKYAYNYTFDKGNYFSINDAFQFESSIDELNSYINGR